MQLKRCKRKDCNKILIFRKEYCKKCSKQLPLMFAIVGSVGK